jgi:hypothetical protein
MTWYILKGGTKEGPYPDERPQEFLGTGYVKPHDLVWKQGIPKWAFAADVPGLSVPPPGGTGPSQPFPPEALEPRQETLRLHPSDGKEPSHNIGLAGFGDPNEPAAGEKRSGVPGESVSRCAIGLFA